MNETMKIPAVRRQTSIQIPRPVAVADGWIRARNDLFAYKSDILMEIGSPIARTFARGWNRLMSGLGSCADDTGKVKVPHKN